MLTQTHKYYQRFRRDPFLIKLLASRHRTLQILFDTNLAM